MKMDFKLSGFDDFAEDLKKLGPAVERKVVRRSVISAMRPARAFLKSVAPVQVDGQRSKTSKKYGHLRQNIRLIRLKKVEKGQAAARVDTGKAFWGVMYELGTRYQPARPWFGPAFRKVSDLVLKTLSSDIGKGIEDIARKRQF